jgi:hypothetical protein
MGSQKAIDRIVDDARAFSDGVVRCHATPFNAADFEDAYNRLSRLRDRYLKDKFSLDLSEQQALAKVFEDDKFIEGMLNIRQVGEHVQHRTGAVLRTTSNAPIILFSEVSAGSMFAAPVVHLRDAAGQLHLTDHLRNLEEAEKRVQRALARAMNKLP